MTRIAAASRCTGMLLAVSLALGATHAAAATLRPFGTLAGPTVAVSDLWDDAGGVAAVVLGPAPAPGERIVVEAAQLAAIARQFGVAWHAEGAASRSILERPGVLLGQDKITAALRAWLTTAGAPPGGIELAGFEAPLVAPDATAAVAVEQCSWDTAGERFSAAVAVTGRAMGTLRLRVSGRVVELTEALLATRRLSPGVILSSADFTPGTLPTERLHGAVAAALPQVTGLMLRHAVAEGGPVMLADLAPPVVVNKGGLVAIVIEAAGVTLAATGEALQSGSLGERIRVRNPTSRAVLLAEVTGPGTVRVEPGSLPVRASSQTGAAPAGGGT